MIAERPDLDAIVQRLAVTLMQFPYIPPTVRAALDKLPELVAYTRTLEGQLEAIRDAVEHDKPFTLSCILRGEDQ